MNALFAIEERSSDGAVGNVMILPAALIVLLDDVVDGLTAEDPIGGVKIRLEYSGTQYSGSATVAMDDTFNGVEYSFLFLDVGGDLHNFWVAFDLLCNGL